MWPSSSSHSGSTAGCHNMSWPSYTHWHNRLCLSPLCCLFISSSLVWVLLFYRLKTEISVNILAAAEMESQFMITWYKICFDRKLNTHSNNANEMILYLLMSCKLEVDNTMLSTQLSHQHELDWLQDSDQWWDWIISWLFQRRQVIHSVDDCIRKITARYVVCSSRLRILKSDNNGDLNGKLLIMVFTNLTDHILAQNLYSLLVNLPKSRITADLHSFIPPFSPSVGWTSTFSSISFFPRSLQDSCWPSEIIPNAKPWSFLLPLTLLKPVSPNCQFFLPASLLLYPFCQKFVE